MGQCLSNSSTVLPTILKQPNAAENNYEIGNVRESSHQIKNFEVVASGTKKAQVIIDSKVAVRSTDLTKDRNPSEASKFSRIADSNQMLAQNYHNHNISINQDLKVEQELQSLDKSTPNFKNSISTNDRNELILRYRTFQFQSHPFSKENPQSSKKLKKMAKNKFKAKIPVSISKRRIFTIKSPKSTNLIRNSRKNSPKLNKNDTFLYEIKSIPISEILEKKSIAFSPKLQRSCKKSRNTLMKAFSVDLSQRKLLRNKQLREEDPLKNSGIRSRHVSTYSKPMRRESFRLSLSPTRNDTKIRLPLIRNKNISELREILIGKFPAKKKTFFEKLEFLKKSKKDSEKKLNEPLSAKTPYSIKVLRKREKTFKFNKKIPGNDLLRSLSPSRSVSELQGLKKLDSVNFSNMAKQWMKNDDRIEEMVSKIGSEIEL